MTNHKLRSLRQHLERCHSLEPPTQTSFSDHVQLDSHNICRGGFSEKFLTHTDKSQVKTRPSTSFITGKQSDMTSWSKRLREAWRGFATFIIHKPQLDQDISQSDYAWKIRLYPYLLQSEEERDWLEKSYRNFSYNN